jgi:hypothetical protein
MLKASRFFPRNSLHGSRHGVARWIAHTPRATAVTNKMSNRCVMVPSDGTITTLPVRARTHLALCTEAKRPG